MTLSKDADKLICIIYKEYLRRREDNKSKSAATLFMFNDIKQIVPNYDERDLATDLSELSHNNVIKLYIGGDFQLLSNGIIYMENRFKNGIKEVTDFISKFIP